MKKGRIKTLIICLALPLLLGGIAGILNMESMKDFGMLDQPPLSPPAWLFPISWTVLYLLMGYSSFLVIKSSQNTEDLTLALKIYGIGLVFNFAWSFIFFGLDAYGFALVWIVALVLITLYNIFAFARISKTAAWLLVPYILWLAFATYLNLGIYLLN